MTIHHAPIQLADLACSMRPDWPRPDTDGAIRACGLAGWTWPQTVQATVRLACDPSSSPRDLAEASRKPLDHRPGLPPQANAEQAGRARDLLEAALAVSRDGES